MAERVGGGIDVALLPINGRAPERRVAGNLNGEEAAALAHEIGARLAVPMHFEMFEFNTEPPDAFVAACERLGQPLPRAARRRAAHARGVVMIGCVVSQSGGGTRTDPAPDGAGIQGRA